MYRQKFFNNIRNIVMFGVLGTFITFGSFFGLTTLALGTFTFYQTELSSETGATTTTAVSFSMMEVLLMSSLLCSTDVIAAVSMLSPKKTPKLFSLVFGEGIVNDAVSIILFNTVSEFAKNS
jgi:sodium/hydrogen exchanger-like protein 6/7/sodium/hydrogen exchanger 8